MLNDQTTPDKDGQKFMALLANEWRSYKDASGNYLNIQPHWAEQWQGIKMRGESIINYLHDHCHIRIFQVISWVNFSLTLTRQYLPIRDDDRKRPLFRSNFCFPDVCNTVFSPDSRIFRCRPARIHR
ncbi:hypothetical protein CI610_00872 [invertebrate metagenome]|uniref:Uncharacterized protein n=1 Tax=invertebrate metagenome TaxID=1711999 RepID=A0A2H9TAC5_9ZZZZ